MGRPRKYTAKRLGKALDGYFASISRTVTLTERVPSGRKDEWGHEVQETRPILNDAGEPIQIRQYEVPPTVGGICEYLGIHRSTWADYCDPDLHPEFQEATEGARELMHAYLEVEALRRKGADLKGVLFSMENNFGCRERKEIELGPRATKAMAGRNMTTAEREELLGQLADEFFRRDGGADDG